MRNSRHLVGVALYIARWPFSCGPELFLLIRWPSWNFVCPRVAVLVLQKRLQICLRDRRSAAGFSAHLGLLSDRAAPGGVVSSQAAPILCNSREVTVGISALQLGDTLWSLDRYFFPCKPELTLAAPPPATSAMAMSVAFFSPGLKRLVAGWGVY